MQEPRNIKSAEKNKNIFISQSSPAPMVGNSLEAQWWQDSQATAALAASAQNYFGLLRT